MGLWSRGSPQVKPTNDSCGYFYTFMDQNVIFVEFRMRGHHLHINITIFKIIPVNFQKAKGLVRWILSLITDTFYYADIYVISLIMYKNHIPVLTCIKSTIVVHIRYACFSIFIKCFFFQQKHVYLYIIDLFTGYDDDSKLNVTRDSNYFTMTWKSKIENR